MKERTLRFILDSLFCDAMSPEFKKANDILLRIVKMNDRTDGLPHTRLVEIGKAFKANDAKAARAAFDKLKPLIAKGDKDLADGLAEAKSKLTEAMQNAERTKAVAVAAKGAVALFDRFRKAIDGVKAKPSAASKLSAYSDRLKAYGDFSKRVAQIAQMAAAKKDVSKQADMLASACDKGKAKADRERVKVEKEYAAAKDRVSVFREMEKIRTRKIAEFAKQKGEVQSLGEALPNKSTASSKENKTAETMKRLNREAQEKKEKLATQLSYVGFDDPYAPPGAIDTYVDGIIAKAQKLYGEIDKAKENVEFIFKREHDDYMDTLKENKGNVAKSIAALEKAKSENQKMKPIFGDSWRFDESVFDELEQLIRRLEFGNAWEKAKAILDKAKAVLGSNFGWERAEPFINAMKKLVKVLFDIEDTDTLEDYSTRPELPESARKPIKEKYINLYTQGARNGLVDLLSQVRVNASEAPQTLSKFKSLVEKAKKERQRK